eukprot:SAG31_NODE_26529_length_440_cov_1.574780_1_plen_89_part_00
MHHTALATNMANIRQIRLVCKRIEQPRVVLGQALLCAVTPGVGVRLQRPPPRRGVWFPHTAFSYLKYLELVSSHPGGGDPCWQLKASE